MLQPVKDRTTSVVVDDAVVFVAALAVASVVAVALDVVPLRLLLFCWSCLCS
jgi:hypothetical protein